ncbi:heme exporter protein CcmD [Alphaproteobacteria bacterium]|jgi:heme exporter protein CcmD|nr:heme exporter protein CcmD [Alphaproteobacteria bacterium]MDA8872656.1 heme exporter protein CcmD [Alphaproteobacteria bacterium]MDA9055344.1 heme exporter protein CcmD [Alphaproteobacteria bacterium]MDA9131782.1 heme exporter protein CcmD [Alphaproteobacteria bacterium]MDB0013479.1 heme exporter protein CcmD [Alphaproteobacteria bacterium]
MAEFFNMGGFGTYIWTSYGFAVICLGWLNYASWRKAKNTAKQLAILQAATPSSPKSAG